MLLLTSRMPMFFMLNQNVAMDATKRLLDLPTGLTTCFFHSASNGRRNANRDLDESSYARGLFSNFVESTLPDFFECVDADAVFTPPSVKFQTQNTVIPPLTIVQPCTWWRSGAVEGLTPRSMSSIEEGLQELADRLAGVEIALLQERTARMNAESDLQSLRAQMTPMGVPSTVDHTALAASVAQAVVAARIASRTEPFDSLILRSRLGSTWSGMMPFSMRIMHCRV